MDTADVIDVAASFGIELSDERAEELARRTEEFRRRLDVFEPVDPADDPVEEVEPGSDEYDAFRYAFRLEDAGTDGPLDDLEVGIKDNVAVAGVPMRCGAEAMWFEPPYHATVTQRLLADGATVVGTTNMDKLAYFTTGETCDFGAASNPIDDERVPGGSSSGSGAAVAGGLVDGALGTDTGGSVRIPASFCGVVGFKPTHRSASRFGVVDLAPSLDHVGAIASSVEVAARIVDSITGVDVHDPSTYATVPPADAAPALDEPIDGLRIGLVEEAFELSDDDVARCVRESASRLEEAGCVVEWASLTGYEDSISALTTIESCEFASLLLNDGHVYATGTGYSEGWRRALEQFVESGEYGEHLRESLVVNGQLLRSTDGRQYVAAQNARRDHLRRVSTLFEAYDALITPTTPTTAPAFGEVSSVDDLLRTEANTGPFNLTGHPALSVPCGRVDGLPVGLQVVGDWREEALVARVGNAVEPA